MTDTAFPNASNCTNCMDDLETWVSHNDGTDWFQIAYNTAQRKVASRNNAQQIKLEGTPTNVCTTSSKSWAYQIDFWYCLTHPIERYIEDGDSVKVRVVNGNMADSDPWDEFTADYDDDGWQRDAESTTPEKRTVIFNATSEITVSNLANVVGAPYADP